VGTQRWEQEGLLGAWRTATGSADITPRWDVLLSSKNTVSQRCNMAPGAPEAAVVEPENWLQIRDTFKLADVAKVEVVAAPADSESGATAEAAAPKKKAQPKAKAKGTEGKTQPKAKAKGTEGKTQQPKKKKADRSRGAAVSIAVPDQGKRQTMSARGLEMGTIKWFSPAKAYGFIVPNDPNQPEVFIHKSVVKSARKLVEGEAVEYEIDDSDIFDRVQASLVIVSDTPLVLGGRQDWRKNKESKKAPTTRGSGKGKRKGKQESPVKHPSTLKPGHFTMDDLLPSVPTPQMAPAPTRSGSEAQAKTAEPTTEATAQPPAAVFEDVKPDETKTDAVTKKERDLEMESDVAKKLLLMDRLLNSDSLSRLGL